MDRASSPTQAPIVSVDSDPHDRPSPKHSPLLIDAVLTGEVGIGDERQLPKDRLHVARVVVLEERRRDPEIGDGDVE